MRKRVKLTRHQDNFLTISKKSGQIKTMENIEKFKKRLWKVRKFQKLKRVQCMIPVFNSTDSGIELNLLNWLNLYLLLVSFKGKSNTFAQDYLNPSIRESKP